MKIGDTIVCIDNKMIDRDGERPLKLTINKHYTIIDYSTDVMVGFGETSNIWIRILNDQNNDMSYPIDKFITIEENRHNKLNIVLNDAR